MKQIKYGVVALVLAMMGSGAWAFSMERYVEGVHYVKVEGAEYAANSVAEFFSFGCPHCNHLEPFVETWLADKPDAVNFTRVPATWNANYLQLARAYYVVESLGVEAKAVPLLFSHIHDKKQSLATAEDLAAVLKQLDVKPEQVTELWDSEDVSARIAEAGKMFATYQLRGVPAIVVNGQYKTSAKMAGSGTELFEVVNFLLTK
jgi:thiol:disulfide interchange protein DsbA